MDITGVVDEEYYVRPYNIGPVETFRQFPTYFPELINYIDNHYHTIANRDIFSSRKFLWFPGI